MDAVPRRPDDLRHVGPHAIPAGSAEGTAIACPTHGDVAGASLVQQGVDIRRLQVGVAEALPLLVRVDLDHVRILDGAAQATDAELLLWGQAADRPGEHPVDARTAQDDRQVGPVVDELLEDEPDQSMLLDLDPEAGREAHQIRRRADLDTVAAVAGPAGGDHC